MDVEIGQRAQESLNFEPMSIKEWENIMTIQGIWSRPVYPIVKPRNGKVYLLNSNGCYWVVFVTFLELLVTQTTQ